MKRNANQEQAMALPAALMVVLLLVSVGAIFTNISMSGLQHVKKLEKTKQNFQAAEGAANDIMSQMAVNPESWREANPLADLPDGYTEYVPAAYSASNGIPTCSGSSGCHRQMYPTGGGLVKNAGPLSGDGGDVLTDVEITAQVSSLSLPVADVVLNNQSAWSQVERLDEVIVSEGSMGGSLESGNTNAGSANAVRFRITGISLNDIKGRDATSTVVYVVEVPGT